MTSNDHRLYYIYIALLHTFEPRHWFQIYVYFSGASGVYVLERLQPKTTYDFRFGAKNLVGFSEWGAGQQFTMPQRGPPEAPQINLQVKSTDCSSFVGNAGSQKMGRLPYSHTKQIAQLHYCPLLVVSIKQLFLLLKPTDYVDSYGALKPSPQNSLSFEPTWAFWNPLVLVLLG